MTCRRCHGRIMSWSSILGQHGITSGGRRGTSARRVRWWCGGRYESLRQWQRRSERGQHRSCVRQTSRLGARCVRSWRLGMRPVAPRDASVMTQLLTSLSSKMRYSTQVCHYSYHSSLGKLSMRVVKSLTLVEFCSPRLPREQYSLYGVAVHGRRLQTSLACREFGPRPCCFRGGNTTVRSATCSRPEIVEYSLFLVLAPLESMVYFTHVNGRSREE